MLNLEKLVFEVDTKQLVEAVTKVQELGTAVANLGTKATAATTKVEKTKESVAKQTKSVEESTEAVKKNVSVLERQQSVLEFMAQGFSKGQASVLSYAKAAGAATQELQDLGKVLDRQRTLMGTDPFDKSIGAIKALANEYTTLKEVNRLYNADLGLTKKQMSDLAREKLRLIEKMKVEGKSFSDLKKAIQELNMAYLKNASAENAVDSTMKQRQKTIQDTGKANEYLAKEMERVNRMMQGGADLTSTTNNKLIKFEEALKKSGMTAAQQTVALEKYKKQLMEIQQMGGNRQVDYLSRALGPQITDIFVGLATGQSPLTVLLQQGGQLRDQFALAGVAGAEMGNMLTQAAKTMILSVKDIAAAVGGLFVNAIKGAGNSIVNFATEVTGLNTLLAKMEAQIISTHGATSTLMRVFSTAAAGLKLMTGVIAGGVVIALAAYAKGLYDVIKEENALARQLALTNGQLGLSQTAALDLAKSMNEIGVSTGDAITVISEMAKAGNFTAKEIATVTKAAVDLNTYAGVAIEDTVKSFSKMKKEPVEALFELAKTTGMVSTETIKSVIELREQGRTAEATALSIKTLADVNSAQVDRMKADYNGFSLFMIELGKGISNFFAGVFKDLFYKASPKEALKKQLDAVNDILNNNAGVVGMVAQIDSVRQGYEKQRNELAKQILLLENIDQQEQSRAADRAKEQSALASFQKDREQFLTSEMKLKRELADAERQYLPLVEKGLVTQLQYAQLIAGIRDKYKEKKGPEENFFDASMKQANRLINESVAEQEKLTKAQEFYLNLQDDPRWNKLSESQRNRLRVLIEEANAQELASDKMQLREKALAQLLANEGRAAKFSKDYYNQLALMDKALVDGAISQEEFNAQLAALNAIQPHVIKRQQEHNKAIEDYVKKVSEQDKANFDLLEGMDQLNTAVDDQTKALVLEGSLIGKTDAQRKLAVGTLKAEVELRKELADIDKSAASESDKITAREAAYQRFADKVRNINTELVIDWARDIQEGLSDAVVTALFEGGKAGKKKLRDLIVAELKKPVTMVINAVVNTIMGKVLGAAGINIPGMSGGFNMPGFSDSSGVLGAIAASPAAYGSILGTGAATGAGSQAAMLAAQTGEFGLAGLGLTGQAAGTTAGGFVSGLASAAPWVAGALAVAALIDATDTPGEQHTGGMFSTRGSTLDMGLAREITGGGGWDDGAWARDLVDRQNPEMANLTKTAVTGALGQSNQQLSALGLGGYTIDAGFAANTNGQGSDSNAFGYFNLYDDQGNLVEEYINRELGPDLQAAIVKFGGDIQEAVASVVLEGTNFKREGETNAQTLARLSTSISAVNPVLETLGIKTLDISLAGGDAASSLVDLFGSIENFTNASAAFYDKFASEEQKLADAQKKVNTTFAELNMTVPKTREEYLKLVQGLDLSTESGRKAYAALLGVSDAFLIVETAAEKTAREAEERQERAAEESRRAAEESRRAWEQAQEAARRAAEEAQRTWEQGVQKAYSALQKAVNLEKQALQEQLNLAKAIYDISSQAVRDLRGQATSTNQMLISDAKSIISTIISSGILPEDPNQLSEAIAKVREELENTQFKSKVEQDIATITLANELQAIADLAEPQMTTAELQLEQLELILEQNRLLVEAALGNTEATLTVQQAVAALAAALGNRPSPGGSGPSNPPSTPNPNSGLTGVGFSSTTTKDINGVYNTGYVREVDGQYEYTSVITDSSGFTSGPAVTDSLISNRRWTAAGYATQNPDVVQYYNSNKALIAELGQADNLAEYLNYHFITYGISENRRFAKGGAFSNGIVSQPTTFDTGLMGEAGPEAIMPLTNVGGSLGVRSISDPRLAEAVEKMNENIEMLRAEIRADVGHNAKTARLLDRVIQDGQTISVTANIDGGTI